MVPRDPHEDHRVATPLELFTDLCFVVAIAQAAGAMHHEASAGHIGQGLVHFFMVFFAIWWAWLNFAWFSSAYDNDDVFHRVMTLVQVAGSLILAAGVPRLFEDDFTLVVVGYVVMRIALVIQWLRAAQSHPEGRATALRYAFGITAVQVLWVGYQFVPDDSKPWFFLLGVAAEISVPVWAERAGTTPWHPHHIAERYGLFLIIVLGETVLSTTFAIQEAIDGDYPVAELAGIVIGGLLIIFSAWWLYFSREAGELLTGNDVGYLWGFGHYFIFASGALIGAGLAARVDYLTHHSEGLSDIASSALVTGPAAAFLAALWIILVRLHDPSVRTWGPFALAIVLILGSTFVPGTVLIAGLICVALLVVELRVTEFGRTSVSPSV